MDETIAPNLYRSHPSDPRLPRVGAFFLVLVSVFLGWFSGPYFWPWGLGGLVMSLAMASVLLIRARFAHEVLRVDQETLGFQTGRWRLLAVGALTRVEVRPSAARTRLWQGDRRNQFSHRLVRVNELLDWLRRSRPDLFAVDPDRLVFRRSSVMAVFQTGLALGTAVAGGILGTWQPWVGGFFQIAAGYVFVRVLLFIPRRYVVTSGTLTTWYWLRRKRWTNPSAITQESSWIDGVEFFRMDLEYGPSVVTLDETQLLDSLRDRADRVSHLLWTPRS